MIKTFERWWKKGNCPPSGWLFTGLFLPKTHLCEAHSAFWIEETQNVLPHLFKIASWWPHPAGSFPDSSYKPRWCFQRYLTQRAISWKWKASVWLLPLTGIHHLECFDFSNLSQLTSQVQAQQSQIADSFPFPLRHYWHILTRHYSGSKCWGNIIIGCRCEGLVCKHKMILRGVYRLIYHHRISCKIRK